MYQYASKGKMQSEGLKSGTSTSNKNHAKTEIKTPMQLMPKRISSPLQMQLRPQQENSEAQPLPMMLSEEQSRLAPRSAQSNNTGIPLQMKVKFENFSGFSFDDVKVHYNSDKPAQLQALAYTQGNQVYIGPGQEKHLGHELGHVVQQKQGRVKISSRVNNIPINNEQQLEKDADTFSVGNGSVKQKTSSTHIMQLKDIVQAKNYNPIRNEIIERPPDTQTIRIGKNKAKQDFKSRFAGKPVPEFTAHHKYPWNRIKGDIEHSFEITDPKEQERIDKIEKWSGCEFPNNKDGSIWNVMTDDESHRKTIYDRNHDKIDDWIQDVCWIPSNIFIGPLSNDREDDPSKRPGGVDVDAHYTRARKMSDVSSQTMAMYQLGGIHHAPKSAIPEAKPSVSPYNIDEWEKDPVSGSFHQVGDAYYEEKIYNYRVTSPNFQTNNQYTLNNFNVEIETPDNITSIELGYRYIQVGNAPQQNNPAMNLHSEDLANKTKGWRYTIPLNNIGDRIHLTQIRLIKSATRSMDIVRNISICRVAPPIVAPPVVANPVVVPPVVANPVAAPQPSLLTRLFNAIWPW